jgi:sugar phosphate isomerase/epimerase
MTGIGFDLLLAHNSLPPGIGFDERARVAAAAGFVGIGASVLDYEASPGRPGVAGQRRVSADRYGVGVWEIEPVIGFDGGGVHVRRGERGAEWGPASLMPGLKRYDRETETASFELAAAVGARHFVAVGSWGEVEAARSTDEFGALCDRAGRHGLQIALEFVVGTSVPTLRDAARVVSEAGRANGGVCLDTWHLLCGDPESNSIDWLGDVSVPVVQLSDGTRPGPGLDAIGQIGRGLHERRAPGTGEFDLVGVLTHLLRRDGELPLISVEVLSDSLAAAPVEKSAIELHDTAAAVVRTALAHHALELG